MVLEPSESNTINHRKLIFYYKQINRKIPVEKNYNNYTMRLKFSNLN